MVIDAETSVCFKDIDDDDDVQSEFFDSVRSYYVESCAYILAKFPLEEEWLKHAEVVDVSRRRSTSFASVMIFFSQPIEKLAYGYMANYS